MAKIKLPAPPKSKMKAVKCVGGPWAKQEVMLPIQPESNPLSLPIRVGEYVGRYNLNTGHWVPMEQRS